VANSYTPILALRQPAQGDDYWDDDLNANAAILEATLGRGSGYAGVIGSGLAVSDGGGRQANVTAGSCRVNGTLLTHAATWVICPDNSLTVVYVDAAGNMVIATAPPTPPYCALALVETSGGAIVRLGDLRRTIADVRAEHTAAGKHDVIKPTRIEPSGSDGAYRRSAAAGHQDPESRVNNLILKNDPDTLIYLANRSEGFVQEYTAAELGNGFVPADANGLVVGARSFDTTAAQRSRWHFYPSDAPDDDDVREVAVARSYSEAGVVSQVFYSQLMFRLSPQGKFKIECRSAPYSSAYLKVRLVGWIEPA
jgi:hypothetical protein